jgi:hypothetical protein
MRHSMPDRALGTAPESGGMPMNAVPSRYAEVVLWCGGRADLSCLFDGQVPAEAPKCRDAVAWSPLPDMLRTACCPANATPTRRRDRDYGSAR